VNPPCNISQYNQSLILDGGSSALPPRVEMDGMITTYGGAQSHWVAHWCTPAQRWFNRCVKYFSFYFGFVNALPLPWTVSIFMHAYYPRKKARGKIGVDFYGTRSSSIWFHLPVALRRRVATIALVALLVQIPDCICHGVFWSYLAIQTWPGNLITNVWLGIQIGCQVAASVLQGRGEDAVRREQTGRFPPTLGAYIREAYRRWREAHSSRPYRCRLVCGHDSFASFVRDEMRNFSRESEKYGRVSTLTGVHHAEIGRKRHVLYRSAGTNTDRHDLLEASRREQSKKDVARRSWPRCRPSAIVSHGQRPSRSRVHPEVQCADLPSPRSCESSEQAGKPAIGSIASAAQSQTPIGSEQASAGGEASQSYSSATAEHGDSPPTVETNNATAAARE